MIKATKRRAMSVLRTPGAVALLAVGAVCFTSILLWAPPDVRGWIIGPGAGGAIASVLALFVRLRGDSGDPEPSRESAPADPPS